MISRTNRINAFVKLGEYLKNPTQPIELEEIRAAARNTNSWFIPENVQLSLDSIATNFLQREVLTNFADTYAEVAAPKKVGVVMAGNVPAVGFHDALTVLLSGHHLLAKLSKDDTPLMHFLLSTLVKIEPDLGDFVSFVDRINAADAYIATGSDNTARYFNYYFAKKPHIIRKNRTSVAVLTGNETREELNGLVQDILLYFGLGCRNVSKLYVPVDYDFTPLFESAEEVRALYTYHHKYFNNYEYNRSILLVNRTEHLDNGFLIMTENQSLVSPLSVVYHERYESMETLGETLAAQKDVIQCIVGNPETTPATISFGKAQQPSLFDFADGVDTMHFLSAL